VRTYARTSVLAHCRCCCTSSTSRPTCAAATVCIWRPVRRNHGLHQLRQQQFRSCSRWLGRHMLHRGSKAAVLEQGQGVSARQACGWRASSDSRLACPGRGLHEGGASQAPDGGGWGGTWTMNGGRACLLFLIGRNILAGACTTCSVPWTAEAGADATGPLGSVLRQAAVTTRGLGCTRRYESAARGTLKATHVLVVSIQQGITCSLGEVAGTWSRLRLVSGL